MKSVYKVLENDLIIDNNDIFHIVRFDDKLKEKIKKEDHHVFDLIKNVMSIYMDVNYDSISFGPAMVMGGKRSFAPEDIDDQQYELLKGIIKQDVPLCVKAKIGDLIWHEKKEIDAARIALDAYSKLYIEMFSKDDWLTSMEIAYRIISLSKQIKDKQTYEWIVNDIYDKSESIISSCKNMLIVWLVEILVKEKVKSIETIDKLLLKIINNNDNSNIIERSFELRIELYKGVEEKDRLVKKEIAGGYVEQADSLAESDFRSCVLKIEKLNKASQLFLECGEKEESNKIQRKIPIIQKKIPRMMQYFSHSVDVKEVDEKIDVLLDGLTFEESIIRLSQFTKFSKYDEIKEKIISGGGSFTERVFGKMVINTEGQTIFNLKPLDLENPNKDKTVLKDHIHNEMARLEEIDGNIVLKRVISKIKEKYNINKDGFDFLVKDNALIPEGRSESIGLAIYLFFDNHQYEALHILAPQTENIFRYVAEKLGGVVYHTNKEGVTEVKTLTSIFDIPELKEGFDQDVLFEFEGLLNRHSGANIRNMISHGIANPNETTNGKSTFFVCALIKLLIGSSATCLDIYSKSDRLKETNTSFENNEE